MVENIKKININTALFQIQNKTRKNKPKQGGDKIKVKSDAKSKTDTLKKRSILRMIRQHQEDKYKKMFDETQRTLENKTNSTENIGTFQSDFEKSKEFLEKIVEDNKNKINVGNRTLKQYPSITEQSVLLHPSINIGMMENVVNNIDLPKDLPTFSLNTNVQSSPQYGCMKGGTLPTYRQFMNKTQRNYPSSSSSSSSSMGGNIDIQGPIQPVSIPNILPQIPNSSSQITGGLFSNPVLQNIKQKAVLSEPTLNEGVKENIKKMSELDQTISKMNRIKSGGVPIRRRKQKRTLRRTYKVGKSKVVPKISVLVSNRTIRNNITAKAQLLKQVPINEIKRYLIKHGFIKIGTTAPNDVLRKMYESAMLICGEVKNHNPDNLLYNYLNGSHNE
jgi:hypothetical protein